MLKISLMAFLLIGALLFGYFGYEYFSQSAAPTAHRERELVEIIPFQPGEELPRVAFSQSKFTPVKVIKFQPETENDAENSEKVNAAHEKEAGEIIVPRDSANPEEELEKKTRKKNIISQERLAFMKKEASDTQNIIDKYDDMRPEDIKLNSDFASRASELRKAIEELYLKGQEKKKELDKLSREHKKASEELRTARSRKEATGWYYMYDKNKTIHAIKEEPSGGKGPVKYVFPEDDRDKKAQEKVKPQLEKAEREFKELSEKYSAYKQSYLAIKKDYKAYLEKENSVLLKKIKEAEEQLENTSGRETQKESRTAWPNTGKES